MMEWFVFGFKLLQMFFYVFKRLGPYLREAFLEKETFLKAFKRRPDLWILMIVLMIVFGMLTVVGRHASEMSALVGKQQGTVVRLSNELKTISEDYLAKNAVLTAEIDRLKKASSVCTLSTTTRRNKPRHHKEHNQPIAKPSTSNGGDRSLIYNLDKLRSQQNHQQEQP